MRRAALCRANKGSICSVRRADRTEKRAWHIGMPNAACGLVLEGLDDIAHAQKDDQKGQHVNFLHRVRKLN